MKDEDFVNDIINNAIIRDRRKSNFPLFSIMIHQLFLFNKLNSKFRSLRTSWESINGTYRENEGVEDNCLLKLKKILIKMTMRFVISVMDDFNFPTSTDIFNIKPLSIKRQSICSNIVSKQWIYNTTLNWYSVNFS